MNSTHSPLTFVYWIRKPEHTDMYSEGYIGVSKQPELRWKQHITQTEKGNHPNRYLSSIIAKYKETLVYEIVYLSNEEACYAKEKELRPSPSIGWNLMEGGIIGKPTTEGIERIRQASSRPWSKQKRWKLYKSKNKTPKLTYKEWELFIFEQNIKSQSKLKEAVKEYRAQAFIHSCIGRKLLDTYSAETIIITEDIPEKIESILTKIYYKEDTRWMLLIE